MIRSTGFARKTRRLTKGGSLPAKPGIKSLVSLFFSKASNGASERKTEVGNEPMKPFGSNGASAHIDSERSESLGPSAPSREGEMAQLLENAITDLVASEAPVSPDSNSTSCFRPLDNEEIVRRSGQSRMSEGDRGTAARPITIPRWKRILDVTLILLTVPVWLPLMIVLMTWIRVTSAGPIFYRQERIGFRRDRFMIFKFRTMRVNAETRTHEEYFAYLMQADCPMTKLDIEGDSRLISYGRFLRATGLDELPQIFNVLRGDMSLVGPRPCLPHEFQRYEAWQQARVNVLPGLTGYWQVNGKNKTTFNEMMAMDIFYAQHMSLWVDLMIMLKTIPALIEQTLESRAQNRLSGPVGRAAVAESLDGAVRKI